MSEVLKLFGSLRTLKKAAKNYSLKELEDMKAKLESVIERRIEGIKKEEKAQEEKLEKIELVKVQMKELGLTAEDITSPDLAVISSDKPKVKRPVKYSLVDADGQEVPWTGIGRMPVVYEKALEGGAALEDFLINK